MRSVKLLTCTVPGGVADRWYVSTGDGSVGPVSLELLARGIEAGKVPLECFVITSYSIHYTKLYEPVPVCRFDLKTNFVDLDRYLPPSGEKAKAEPWDLGWLRQYDVAGHLQVRQAVYRNLDFSAVGADVAVHDGTLRVAPLSATFYNGTLNGALEGVLRNNFV